MFTELTQDNLQQVVESNELTFVQFSAGWCGNCRIMKPRFKKMSQEYNAEFVVVDAEQFVHSRQLAEVTNLPTFAAFRGGKFVSQVQTNKSETLKNFIDEVTND